MIEAATTPASQRRPPGSTVRVVFLVPRLVIPPLLDCACGRILCGGDLGRVPGLKSLILCEVRH